MKIYRAEHDGVFLGGVSVVVATDKDAAEKMIQDELRSRCIDANNIELEAISLEEPRVYALFDGDY